MTEPLNLQCEEYRSSRINVGTTFHHTYAYSRNLSLRVNQPVVEKERSIFTGRGKTLQQHFFHSSCFKVFKYVVLDNANDSQTPQPSRSVHALAVMT